MKHIPYDRTPGNIQWWTRSPFAFIAYLIRVLVFKKHGS